MHESHLQAPNLEQREARAREAFAGLPQEFKDLTGDLAFFVQDFPDEEVIDDLELDSPFDILGLFCGPDLAARAGFSLIDRRGIFPTVPVLTRMIRRSPARLLPLHRLLTRVLPIPGWCFLNVLRFRRP